MNTGMSRFLISAAHKSSGKTTLSIGLCAELRRLGSRIQPFKKGPDYIDPLWLSQAAGRACHNLDFYTQSHAEIRATFDKYAGPADIALIEGNKGLYDGMDLDGVDSNAALAELLETPVVLVIDTRGMTRGIAPLLLGYQSFATGLNIAGVILNKVGGSRHEGKLRQVVEHYTDLPLVGAVQRSRELEIVERHLGLMPSNESRQAEQQIESIRRLVADQVDIGRLRDIAAAAPGLAAGQQVSAGGTPDIAEVRIGIAMDEAFGFYYPGDLEALERLGARLVAFSPINDAVLPEVDGIFIGGGFPETRMHDLEANTRMREAVRDFVESDKPLYAECGGLMYLARSLTWGGECCKMVGVIAADAVMHESPQGRGYVRLRERDALSWRDQGAPAQEVTAHEFHYSRLENLSGEQRFAFDVIRGKGIDGRHDGLRYKNMLANYTHLRHVGAYPWAEKFVRLVRRCRNGNAQS